MIVATIFACVVFERLDPGFWCSSLLSSLSRSFRFDGPGASFVGVGDAADALCGVLKMSYRVSLQKSLFSMSHELKAAENWHTAVSSSTSWPIQLKSASPCQVESMLVFSWHG